MDKLTEHLTNEMKTGHALRAKPRAESGGLGRHSFLKTIVSHKQSRNMKMQDVINRSYLNESYAHDIFNAKKIPTKDAIIKLSFALSLSLSETNRLLQLSGHSRLYPLNEREAIIIYCINHGKNLEHANRLLGELNVKQFSADYFGH